MLSFSAIITYLLIFARFHGIALSFLHFRKASNNNSFANHFLALLVLFLPFSNSVAQKYRIVLKDVPFLNLDQFESFYFHLPFSFVLFLGPLAYLYVKYLLGNLKKLQKKDLLHFIPGILESAFHLIQLLLLILNVQTPISSGIHLGTVLLCIHFLSVSIYFYLTFIELKKYRIWIREYFSETSKLLFTRLRNGIIAFGIGWLFYLALFLFISFIGEHQAIYKLLLLYNSVVVFFIGYSDYFTAEMPPEDYFSLSNESANINLSPVKLKELIQLVEQKELYLNPTLNVNDLAKEINLSSRDVSYLINTGMNKNFYEFINNYRVEEVKKRLLKPEFDKHTFEAIGYDSGFNSRTTFHEVFKKFTGTTPRKYKLENTSSKK